MRHGQEPLIFDKISAVDFFDPSGEAESWLRWGRFSGFFWFPSSFCVLYILLDSLNVFTGFRLFADTVADIEQPLPGRNLIYLAYFLPKELENLSSQGGKTLNDYLDCCDLPFLTFV